MPELLKYAEEPVSRTLYALFNKIWRVDNRQSSHRVVGRCHCVTVQGRGHVKLFAACIPPIGSGESVCPRPAEQTGATANEIPELTAIRFHKGKINY